MEEQEKRKKKWIERMANRCRAYKPYLYNRFFVFMLLILFQLIAFVALSYLLAYQAQVGFVVQIIVFIIEILAVLYLINKNDRPSVKLSWILLILILPIVGVPIYLMYGEGRPTKRMYNQLYQAQAENDALFEETFGKIEPILPENRAEGVSHYLSQYGKFPLYRSGELQYFKNGESAFPVILEELEKATKFILLDYFIVEHGKFWNSILEILLKKAEEGVQVRVIYDDFGCIMTLPPHYDKHLESLSSNIRCMPFNHVVPMLALRMNNRDHRKIMVIDGKVAFTGGVNLADEYIAQKERFGYWKDSVIYLKGEVVNSFTKMFFNFWNAFRKDKEELKKYLVKNEKEGGMYALSNQNAPIIHPYDDSPLDKISVGETVYLDIIHRAKKYIYIFTPYLILDDQMRTALCLASMRGVDVRIVTPGIPDKKIVFRITRANYDILQRAGVKIYEYTPGFIHSKSIVSDDECAVVGTINFDYRSLYHHFENGVYFANTKAVLDVKRDAEETFTVSKLCESGYPKRSFFGRLLDGVLRVFETLF